MRTFVVTWNCIIPALFEGNVAQVQDSGHDAHHFDLLLKTNSHHIHGFLQNTQFALSENATISYSSFVVILNVINAVDNKSPALIQIIIIVGIRQAKSL